MATITPIKNFKLDPKIFSQDLYNNVMACWFADAPTPDIMPPDQVMGKWFGQGKPEDKAAFDSQCRDVAGTALQSIGPEHVELPSRTSPADDKQYVATFASPFLSQFQNESLSEQQRQDNALALTILLDQIPRNCFRGKEQKVVYEHYDRISRAVNHAILDSKVNTCDRFKDSVMWQFWFYMPLEHSELVDDHERMHPYMDGMMESAKRRGDTKSEGYVEMMKGAEQKHFDPLQRFGRYPWRNEWMGRESTEEEMEWLETGDRFGTG